MEKESLCPVLHSLAIANVAVVEAGTVIIGRQNKIQVILRKKNFVTASNNLLLIRFTNITLFNFFI